MGMVSMSRSVPMSALMSLRALSMTVRVLSPRKSNLISPVISVYFMSYWVRISLVLAPADRQILDHRAGRDRPRRRHGSRCGGPGPPGSGDIAAVRSISGSWLALLQLGFLLHGLLDGHLQLFGDQLGDPVHLAEGDIQRPADIADDRPGLHGAVGDDLGDMGIAAVLVWRTYSMTSSRRSWQKSTSKSGMELRSRLRKRSKSRP